MVEKSSKRRLDYGSSEHVALVFRMHVYSKYFSNDAQLFLVFAQ